MDKSTNKLAGDVLFIGVGLGGGRMTNAIQAYGYETYYINTAVGDFENLENVDIEMTYPIPKSRGCNKDRELAFTFAANYISDIHNKVNSNYRKYSHFVFLFSLGGGTGSGTAPALAQYFANEYINEKTVSIVGIVPDKSDNGISIQNALDCLEQIQNECPSVRSRILIDNAGGNKFDINRAFAQQIDNLLSLPEIQVEELQENMKSADDRETLSLLQLPNYVTIAKIDSPTKKTGKDEPYVIKELPYIVKSDKASCVEMAVSLSSDNVHDFNPEHLFKHFGRPDSDVKAGINDTNESFVYVFGTQPSQAIVSKLEEWLVELETEKGDTTETEFQFSGNRNKVFGQRAVTPTTSSVNPFAKKVEKPLNPFAGKDALPKTNPFAKKK